LCIGDEVASGTEGISALSIVAAALTQLCQKRVSFIFATHLHDVADMLNLENMKVYHLEVTYDPSTNSIIYDRKLKPGKGSSVYGLEVCKSYDLGDDFMKIANDFRNTVMGHNTSILNTKKSRYNKEHYVDVCDICKKINATEVHHIKEQHMADKDGFIGNIHKNVESNLVNVCEKCHDDIHSGLITVKGYVHTTEGRTLSVSYKEEEKDITKIVKDLRFVAKKTIKEIILECKESYNIDLTTYKVNKMLSSQY
jgi:DNA mismatch repair protein MutS